MNQVILQDSDIQRLGRLSGDDLARLYDYLANRLRATKRLPAPNSNVLSVRLAPEAVDRVTQLALRYQTYRGQIVRQAVVEFLQRNPV